MIVLKNTFNKNDVISPRESDLICRHNSTNGILSISGTLMSERTKIIYALVRCNKVKIREAQYAKKWKRHLVGVHMFFKSVACVQAKADSWFYTSSSSTTLSCIGLRYPVFHHAWHFLTATNEIAVRSCTRKQKCINGSLTRCQKDYFKFTRGFEYVQEPCNICTHEGHYRIGASIQI